MGVRAGCELSYHFGQGDLAQYTQLHLLVRLRDHLQGMNEGS
jgi:hypothetical protein